MNNVGPGVYSDPLELVTDNVPEKMSACTIAESDITYSQITINWSEMPTSKDGGDPITYYLLEWDNGDSTKLESDTWTELTSSSAGIKTQFI